MGTKILGNCLIALLLFTTSAFAGGKVTGNLQVTGLAGSGTRCLQTDNSGNMSVYSAACSTGTIIPAGVIVMWSGTIATIPSGWALCNGSNGTPDLRNQFIVGADADSGGVAKSTITGSALQSSANGVAPAHTHSATGLTASLSSATAAFTYGVAGAGNLSNYFSYQPGTSADTDGVNLTLPVTGTVAVSGSTASTGTGTKNIAVFYALAFIMKT